MQLYSRIETVILLDKTLSSVATESVVYIPSSLFEIVSGSQKTGVQSVPTSPSTSSPTHTTISSNYSLVSR